METLEGRVAEVEAEFELAGEWNDRYRLLVQWGTDLEPLPEAERTETCFVSGCSSPLWLVAGLADARGDRATVVALSSNATPGRLF